MIPRKFRSLPGLKQTVKKIRSFYDIHKVYLIRNKINFFFCKWLATGTSLVVPDMSYSSSEGEDDFFDATDSPFTSGSQLATPS